jgi:hypothetical protein
VGFSGGFGDVLTQDLVNLFLVMLELVGFSSLRTGVVFHFLFARHEKVEPDVRSDGDSAVENLVASLFSTHQFQVVGELFDGLNPLGLLSLIASSLVLDENDFLRVAILDVANGEVGTQLDNTFKRPLFLLLENEGYGDTRRRNVYRM